MRKLDIFGSMIIAGLLIGLTFSLFNTQEVSAAYPDYDYDYAFAGDLIHGVQSQVRGDYQEPVDYLYRDSTHTSNRFAIFPDWISGDMGYRFYTSGYDYGMQYTSEVEATYYRYCAWVSWIATYTTSHFTNLILGGDWIQTASISITASS